MGKILVLGIGNTIRYDDAVGILAVRELKKRVSAVKFDCMELSETGLHLLSLMEDYAAVIIVDSFVTSHSKAGYIHRFDLSQLNGMSDPYSTHQLGIPSLLLFARRFNIKLPRSLVIYGLEIEKNDAFGEGLSPLVAQKLSEFIETIEKEVGAYA